MSSEIDPNSVASSVIVDLARSSFAAVAKGASGAMRSAWDKIFEDFLPFMEDTYNRNANVRILCQKDADVPLVDVYVNSTFMNRNTVVSDKALIETIVEGRNIVVNGNGGAGKTFFMRHLWLTLFSNVTGRTPIFLELRQLEDLSELDLKQFIRRNISKKRELTSDIFSFFCEKGRFFFLLDGFDEVPQESRDRLQKQILEFSSEFPRCVFVVSSRYEPRFAGWQNFDVYESRPFDIRQVRQLIEKVPFDRESKKHFLANLDVAFFNENKSFLSNPLLSIMMMMTFRENMNIPKRMNIFYDQAFSTLYQWHDATKAYSRRKFLDIDEFQRSFGIFCLLSYYRQMYEFTRTEIVDLINQSNTLCGISIPSDNVLMDYEESVNLIRQDGLKYVFIHRSFQEYFAAYALVRVVPDKFDQFLPEISRRIGDNVLRMCFEMNRRLVVRYYIEPSYNEIVARGLLESRDVGQYETLHKIDARYMFSLYVRAARTKAKVSILPLTIRMHMDPQLSLFIENCAKLSDMKTGLVHNLVQIILFDDRLVKIFGRAHHSDDVAENASIIVSFYDNTIRYVLDIDGDVRQFGDDAIVSEFRRRFASSEPAFLQVEDTVKKAIKQVSDWASGEISETEARGRSLNEIFGIS